MDFPKVSKREWRRRQRRSVASVTFVEPCESGEVRRLCDYRTFGQSWFICHEESFLAQFDHGQYYMREVSKWFFWQFVRAAIKDVEAKARAEKTWHFFGTPSCAVPVCPVHGVLPVVVDWARDREAVTGQP